MHPHIPGPFKYCLSLLLHQEIIAHPGITYINFIPRAWQWFDVCQRHRDGTGGQWGAGRNYVRYRGKKRMSGGRRWFAMGRVYAKYTLSPDAFINGFFALSIVSFPDKRFQTSVNSLVPWCFQDPTISRVVSGQYTSSRCLAQGEDTTAGPSKLWISNIIIAKEWYFTGVVGEGDCAQRHQCSLVEVRCNAWCTLNYVLLKCAGWGGVGEGHGHSRSSSAWDWSEVTTSEDANLKFLISWLRLIPESDFYWVRSLPRRLRL
jgi:hypothetical protein